LLSLAAGDAGADGFCASAVVPNPNSAAETSRRPLIPDVIVLLPLNSHSRGAEHWLHVAPSER